MKIKESEISNYTKFIGSVQNDIRNFEGCEHLKILNDINDKTIFFSYSYWQDEESLENYRKSDFFQSIWPEIKQWFVAKPEAWSLNKVDF